MSNRYVLDTNAVIYLLNGRLAFQLPEGEFAVSVISKIELLSFSSLSESEEQKIHELLRELEQIPLNDEVSRVTIELRKKNNKLKLPDAVIAATAIINNAILLTNDQIFSGIEELRVQTLDLTPN
ncbi:type II toxin-antitoxin system VapC family toxin [Chlorobium phaeobacteroides]|jgi:hypothetical protein|uniref:PilT protein domain protein n=1 Tax=Chlorobium phaeobacteroides (strain DSM 266 / SMG 266 / 2430) TaxID=290317 RepID=A1BJQ4_CHLPD|nr:type II toxin-antitoxin system VapC family toxin [Chlorobium phaeobacteroides]ABL66631.1 PilT protein domain protein [Chlorobium phaeobacteroides DSM 266]